MTWSHPAIFIALLACRTEAKPMPSKSADTKSDAPAAISTIEYSTVGGPERGGGVAEFEWHLKVDFTRAVVELRQHSPLYHDDPDAIGVFRAPLDPTDASRLLERAQNIRLDHLPEPNGGGPGVSQLLLRITRGANRTEARFPSRDTAVMPRVEPLLERLEPLLGKVVQQPLQALRLELAGPPGPNQRFRFSLRNVGTMPLTLVDPRSSTGDTQTGVRVAPATPTQPGQTAAPPQWTFLPVAAAQGVTTAPVKLAPGAAIDFETIPWSGKPSGPHRAQAMLSTYAGPPAHQGMPVLKGRLFSARIKLP